MTEKIKTGRKTPLSASAKKEGGRQAMWELMRSAKTFTARNLMDAGFPRETIKTYLYGLTKAGYLTCELSEKWPMFATYTLVNDTGVEAPRVTRDGRPVTQGLCREQMWRTMKRLGDFSPNELAITASTDDQPVAETDAFNYTKFMARAGYLIVLRAKPILYRFVRSFDSGPKPPRVLRIRSVFDQNLRKIMWQEKEEVDD